MSFNLILLNMLLCIFPSYGVFLTHLNEFIYLLIPQANAAVKQELQKRTKIINFKIFFVLVIVFVKGSRNYSLMNVFFVFVSRNNTVETTVSAAAAAAGGK